MRSLLLAVLVATGPALASAADTTPRLVCNDGTIKAHAKGDFLLLWPGELNRRYRLQSSTDLRTWTTVSQIIGLGEECRVRVKRVYVPPPTDPTKPDSEVRKYWRLQPFDFDSDGDGVTDFDESRLGTDPFAGRRVTLANPFVPFAMCCASQSAANQITACQKAGYTGIGLGGGSPSVLKAFADHPEVSSGRFRVYSMLWYKKVAEDLGAANLDAMLVQAARMGMALWVVPSIPKSEDTDGALTEAFYHTIADHCQTYGVQLVLYPHTGCSIQTAEDGLAMRNRLAALGHSEVKTSIHLCHEMVMGNRDRLAAAVAAVKDHIVLATIGGSETSGNSWDQLIQPLDQGAYDPAPFLRLLADAGYTGPIEYHTYALPDPSYDSHFARTLTRWRQLVAPPAP